MHIRKSGQITTNTRKEERRIASPLETGSHPNIKIVGSDSYYETLKGRKPTIYRIEKGIVHIYDRRLGDRRKPTVRQERKLRRKK